MITAGSLVALSVVGIVWFMNRSEPTHSIDEVLAGPFSPVGSGRPARSPEPAPSAAIGQPSGTTLFETSEGIVAAAVDDDSILVALSSGGVVRVRKDGSSFDGVATFGSQIIGDLASGDGVVAVTLYRDRRAQSGAVHVVVDGEPGPRELVSVGDYATLAIYGGAVCVADQSLSETRLRCVDASTGALQMETNLTEHGRPVRLRVADQRLLLATQLSMAQLYRGLGFASERDHLLVVDGVTPELLFSGNWSIVEPTGDAFAYLTDDDAEAGTRSDEPRDRRHVAIHLRSSAGHHSVLARNVARGGGFAAGPTHACIAGDLVARPVDESNNVYLVAFDGSAMRTGLRRAPMASCLVVDEHHAYVAVRGRGVVRLPLSGDLVRQQSDATSR